MPACGVCDNAQGNRPVTAREMLLGLGERFEYFECARCGCLQIGEVPADLSRYYPAHYYSFSPVAHSMPPMRWLRRLRFWLAAGRTPLAHPLISGVLGQHPIAEWAVRVSLRPDHAVLDVGCGAGQLLVRMSEYGFTRLTGIDAFLPSPLEYPNGVRVLNCGLGDLDGEFDLVMLHHSFEHMPEPLAALRHVFRLVRPGRYAIVRIPVGDSHAFRTYGASWVGLDPPRHLHVPTRRSMALLAARVGFRLEAVVDDSSAFQFWASEQYRRGIALVDERSHWGRRGQVFSRAEMRRFERQARALNRRGEGDQACFYLLRPASP